VGIIPYTNRKLSAPQRVATKSVFSRIVDSPDRVRKSLFKSGGESN